MNWIPFGRHFGFVGDDTGSFADSGLAQPGTLIRLRNGSIYMIGHINPIAGICDCCVEFNTTAIVDNYCIVWSEPPKPPKLSRLYP